MSHAPILLFTYNRPSHTRQTLEALLKNKLCSESELFVFSDGYKNETDKKQVGEVRKIIQTIEGFRKINILENTHNVGLAKNIIGGVSRVIEEYGKVIVLEDDLVTSPYFLTFMNEALDMFETENRIGHIHGYCYPLPELPEAFLIKWTGSWGWATWKRAWQQFNPDGKALLDEIKSRKLSRSFDFNGKYPYTRMLERQINRKNDSWAIRWNASLFLKDMLSVNAGRSLVKNIGFDGSGTHSSSQNIYATNLYPKKLSITIPVIEENQAARKSIEKYHVKTNSFWAKVRRRIRKHLIFR
ncbi:glycosyltransferase [Proteiniphilum sp. X52]|uniref:glycosyltransferase n=1 Tax=Proteiniphilum sp. X52 TaxID=2382159 RepID=UPI000F0A8E89|nr:glycosyltransferase [Proteiniphilum sp. X52]RNC66132.1 glycosyltransferase [Proteiniphilum sp. X52]